MTNKRFCLRMLVIVSVFGMMIFGCNDDQTNNSGGNTDPKKLTITGMFPSYYGKHARVFIFAKANLEEEPVANGGGAISSTTITFDLKPGSDLSSNTNWIGSGDFYVALLIFGENPQPEEVYTYDNGKRNGKEKLPFTKATTTAPFHKFSFDSYLLGGEWWL